MSLPVIADTLIDAIVTAANRLHEIVPLSSPHAPAVAAMLRDAEELSQSVDAERMSDALGMARGTPPLPEPPAGCAPVDCWNI